MTKKKAFGLIVSVLILFGMYFVPVPDGLTPEGRNTVGFTIAFLILLMTEVLPSAVICLLSLALMPLLQITTKFSASITGFSNHILFFILASFGISAAFTAVPLARRILILLIKRFGRNVKTMLLSIMICTALISALISNIPTCAIFMSIGLSFLELFENEQEKKRTGRAFMIAIPVASMIGGIMTPAGSSLNLLTISLLEQLGGTTVTFVQWMFVGIPLAVILIPLAWFIIVKVNRPAEIDKAKVQKFIQNLEVPKQMDRKEKSVIVITIVMLVLWIMSSWIPYLEVYTVAMIGCCFLFFPGVEVLSWKKYVHSVSWDVIYITGTVLSIGNVIVANGVSEWLVTTFYPSGLSLPLFGVVALAATFVFLMLILIPIAPALITVLSGPLLAVAATNGYPPQIMFITLGICASQCYLFPIDSVPLLTYGTGYYKMSDMPKSTAILQCCIIILLAIWLPVALSVLGIV